MAHQKKITKRRRKLFLDELVKFGSVVKAAKAGEICRSAWYDLKKRDKDFSRDWDDSEMEYLDFVEGEALRRAVFGVVENKPYTYYKGDVKETRMREVTRKSDRLMELVLTTRHPSYMKIDPNDKPENPTKGTGGKDYSPLTDAELLTLVRLQRKAHAAAEHQSGA